MTPLAVMPPRAALVFDQMAADYDDVFTRSMIGRAQRDSVWSVLNRTFRSGDHILELNCGTGEDALFLSRNSIAVTACDASEQMIAVASSRLRTEALGAPVKFSLLPTERIHELQPATFKRCFLHSSYCVLAWEWVSQFHRPMWKRGFADTLCCSACCAQSTEASSLSLVSACSAITCSSTWNVWRPIMMNQDSNLPCKGNKQ